MPIYEFYCRRCNTVFSFFSKTVNTSRIPKCPRCKKVDLERRMSIFARVKGGKTDTEAAAGDGLPPFDEARMEKAMSMLPPKRNTWTRRIRARQPVSCASSPT